MAKAEEGPKKALFRSALSTSKQAAQPTSQQQLRKSASKEVWSPVRSTVALPQQGPT